GSFTNNATVPSGPTFWMTNYTSKTLTVDLWVEVPDETNWTMFGSPLQSLSINPKQGLYATIPFAYQQYLSNSWRLHGTVAEKLLGFRAAFAALHRLPGALWARYVTVGLPPAVPLNPFAKGAVWYGESWEIIGGQVADSEAIHEN